ncbi:hypothetical protein [Rubritalea tangerina]|uniref:hypothetical protein n=1 Tax=Rubritalea tangerina TaxID=430798 RepID=UPI0036090FC8
MWWKCALGLVVVFLLSGVIGYQMVVSFLHSEGFREKIGKKVSRELGVPVTMGEMQWDGLHMENESVVGGSDGAIESLEANGISLDVDTSYLKREKWEISNVLVQTAGLVLDLRKEFTKLEMPKEKKSWVEKWLPSKAELLDAEVVRADAQILTDGGEYVVDNTSLKLSKEDFGYQVTIEDGVLELPLPLIKEAQIRDASIRVLNERIVIDDAQLDVFASGRLSIEGEVDLAQEVPSYKMYGVLSGLKCADVINEDWKQRLSGDVESKFRVRPKAGNEPEFQGEVVIRDGQLTALPILDTIAAYTVIRDFKRLRFSEFRCDYYRYGQLLRLSDIYVHCDGLMRIEGDLDIDGQSLRGSFDVGLNPGTLSHIPGAEEKVFLPGKEGMHWARVRISGTIDNVEEDLTERIKAAALDRLFEVVGGKEVLRFTNRAAESFGELPEKLGEGGVQDLIQGGSDRVLESGKGALDAASSGDLTAPLKTGGDIIQSGLGGLFGGSTREKEKAEEEE